MAEKEKFLEFERPILELEEKIRALRASAHEGGVESLLGEISDVESKLDAAQRELASRLSPWQRAQLARHPNRPGTRDIASKIFESALPIAGDRAFAEDLAIRTMIARFRGREVFVVSQLKGRDAHERVRHNFGMAHPEGYRKVIRGVRLAERFSRSVITLIDTPGAYPGIGAEERGQAWAIAESLEVFMNLRVPIVAIVVGEGGSGGALALGVADRVLMMENAIYSVISPEGCASILFRDAARAPEAAAAMKVTAKDGLALGVIDRIIEEPPGGAHRNWDDAASRVGDEIEKALGEIESRPIDDLLAERYAKFRKMGVYLEAES